MSTQKKDKTSSLFITAASYVFDSGSTSVPTRSLFLRFLFFPCFLRVLFLPTNNNNNNNVHPPQSKPQPHNTKQNSSTHRHSAPRLHELSPRAAGERSLGRVEQRPRRLRPRGDHPQALQQAVDPLLRHGARQLSPLLGGADPRRHKQRRPQELARVRADVQRDLLGWSGQGKAGQRKAGHGRFVGREGEGGRAGGKSWTLQYIHTYIAGVC